MLSRRTLPVLIGICLLSGMFFMGQGGCPVGPPDPASNLPTTGITKCYNTSSEIPCPAPGEPFYGQDAHYIINPMSYTDHGNGTVTDDVTGLMWQQCSAGLSGPDCSTGTADEMNWDDAIAYCQDLNLAGFTDWRLPDRYELHNIVDAGRYDPAIDTAAFPGTVTTRYWSSSPYAGVTNSACRVNFGQGYVDVHDKTGTFYVRCARGGETPPPYFTVNGNGTVTDNVTGLMWQQQDDNITRNWEAALAYCQDLDLGGATDWRLPDKKELASIVDVTRYDPAIDQVFTGTKSSYWSSSTHAVIRFYAWNLLFYSPSDGTVSISNKASMYYSVRCVR